MSNTESFTDDFGRILRAVHSRTKCAGEACVIHNPSDHTMRGMKLLWRGDRYLFERICEHGCGHPDPDHMAALPALARRAHPDKSEAAIAEFVEAEGVHGCDGCGHG